MFRRLKEFREWFRSEAVAKQDFKEDVQESSERAPYREAVASLPSDILGYWHKALTEDDLLGLQSTDVRIPLKNHARLAWQNFDLGYGTRPTKALAVITARAAEDRRKQEAEALQALEEDPESADDSGEVDTRIPMALVFHHATSADEIQVTWPDPVDKPVKGKKSSRPKVTKLNIAFWFPFDLNDANQVCLPRDLNDCRPRVVRQWLEPQPLIAFNDLPPPIGHYDSYREELKSFIDTLRHSTDLRTYVDACFALFKRIQADGAETGLATISGQWIAVPRQPSYATRALEGVYKAMPQATSIGALGQLILPGRHRSAIQVGCPSPASVIARHVAMVDKAANIQKPDEKRSADPLNDSQRRALHTYGQLASGTGVLAVSGPPGTGKTAMLRAMIANQWVLAAYDSAQHCPVTFVCGATNQSVENVMGTFDGAAGNKHPLARRWLNPVGKNLLGFTASAPSKAKSRSHRKKFTTLEIRKSRLHTFGIGSSSLHLPYKDFAAAAYALAGHFEDAFTKLRPLFDSLFSVEQKLLVSDITRKIRLAQKAASKDALPSRDEFHGYLDALAEVLHSGLRCAIDRQSDVEPLTDLTELTSSFPSEAWSSHWVEDILTELRAASSPEHVQMQYQKLLDVVWRPIIFQLAARYWETRWLADVVASPEPANRRAALRRSAMLFPCIVATLHSAPRLLTQAGEPLFDFLDMLIIDEAGQAAPELGVPVLSLARRAVIVGDMKQLSPVSSVTPEVDARQVRDRWPDSDRLLDLRQRGADSATGSIMKLAATGASFAESMPDGRLRDGLLLREHYRCTESIINVCIDLLYHDHDRDSDGRLLERELVPKIPDPQPGLFADADLPLLDGKPEEELRKRMKASYPLPPLGFYQTGGPNDEPSKGDSWSNPGEARAIVDWLKQNGPPLARWAARVEGNPDQPIALEKIVAIVTPFRGQVEAIRNCIREELDANDDNLSGRLTIGTVHTLQGAEKPVVLFSSVNRESRANCRTDTNHRERVFIDRDDGRLLNVAISRAQKSFILFGHSDLFFSQQAMDPANDLPSAVVGRCLAGVREPEHERMTGAPRTPACKLGPHTLMVVESVHKAKIIQNLVPAGTQVFGCGGHIRDLPGPGAIRWQDGLHPRWQMSQREGGDLTTALRNAGSRLLQCKELVLGTDDDAQGEAIAWHMIQVLKDAPWFVHVRQVRRVRFHSLTEPDMKQAFEEGKLVVVEGATPEERAASMCRALNMGLAYGAIALRVLDNLIGSVYLRHGIPGGGRVKGPLLRALAAHGDSKERPGKRFGIAITLLVNDTAVPARLMVLRGTEGWRRWGTDVEENASLVSAALKDAVVSTTPCLIEHNTELLPPMEQLGTNQVLQEAFRRFGWLPSETMTALQRLYELRADTDESKPLPRNGAWATLDDQGRLCLTEAGRNLANKLLGSSWLEQISANELLIAFDEALTRLSWHADACEQDYVEFLRTWAARFDDCRPAQECSTPIVGPYSATVDAQGFEIMLFAGQPSVDLSSWKTSSVDILPAEKSESVEAGDTPEDLGGGRSGAHGALVPLDLAIEADSEKMAGFSPRQRQLYAMMSKLMLASSLRDGEMHTVRRIYPLTWGVVRPIEVGVEVITGTQGAYAGWFGIDPEGGGRYTSSWAQSGVEALLGAQAPPVLQVVAQDNATRTHSLLEPTVDQLLAWMHARGHGRPSTYGKHIEDLLCGYESALVQGESTDE
ncbi:AAA domain-containing protein [Pseudomonas sp. Irchel 3A5]|uniref:AAA domain-containing protein n=1 Tax=Pseudomonas sp. Irchel 3A5 TaxID=2008911 RepID=UPI0011403137|nr:AAA domain-containing protein [Pseudomonas sp. Irchel 3A5]